MDGYSTRFYTCLPNRCFESTAVCSDKLSDSDELFDGADCSETLAEKKEEVGTCFLYLLTHSICGHIMCGQSNKGRKKNVVLPKKSVLPLSLFGLQYVCRCMMLLYIFLQRMRENGGSQSSDDSDTGGGRVLVTSREKVRRQQKADAKQKAKEDQKKVLYIQ